MILSLDRDLRAERRALDRVDQILQPARVLRALTQVHPRPRAQEWRQGGRIEWVDARQQDGEHAEPALLDCALHRQVHLLALPRSEVAATDEHSARPARGQTCGDLLCPAPPGGLGPIVEPRFQPLARQGGRDRPHRRLVSAVVREKYIERLRSTGRGRRRGERILGGHSKGPGSVFGLRRTYPILLNVVD